MKKNFQLFTIAMLASVVSIMGYTYFLESNDSTKTAYEIPWKNQNQQAQSQLTSFYNNETSSNLDFTTAAEKTVHAVVHVKNLATMRQPRSAFDYYFGSGSESKKAIRGAGSGVILSPDGLIITNNHVIKDASEVQVTLNNNKTYVAEIIGRATENDIALIKIEATDLDYLAFGDSNSIGIGEWVLAVGNPFNLTSTVTAGIVSAKARDLDKSDSQFQSFIQTDAAVNPGNSGGALVNTRGELIGINTAITSQTGSFIGYSFAIPSNNAKKIVEDLIEFGDVRKAILGITGTGLNSTYAEELGVTTSQGFYVSHVEEGSGAKKAGLQKDDIIKSIDNIQIRKYSDLVGYLNSKNPGEQVKVGFIRNDKLREATVTLDIFKVYKIEEIGVEVTDISKERLQNSYGTNSGVLIHRSLSNSFTKNNIAGLLITKINDKEVSNIEEVENLISLKDKGEPLIVTFLSPKGQEKTYVFR